MKPLLKPQAIWGNLGDQTDGAVILSVYHNDSDSAVVRMDLRKMRHGLCVIHVVQPAEGLYEWVVLVRQHVQVICVED